MKVAGTNSEPWRQPLQDALREQGQSLQHGVECLDLLSPTLCCCPGEEGNVEQEAHDQASKHKSLSSLVTCHTVGVQCALHSPSERPNVA